MKTKLLNELIYFKKLSNRELAEAFIFPLEKPLTDKEKQEEEAFWLERRKQFENQTSPRKAHD